MFEYTAEKRNIYRLTLAGLIYGLLRDLNIVINRFGRHKGLFNSILGADIAVRSSIFKFSALSVILSIYALIVLLANKKYFNGDSSGYMSKTAFYSVLFPLGIPQLNRYGVVRDALKYNFDPGAAAIRNITIIPYNSVLFIQSIVGLFFIRVCYSVFFRKKILFAQSVEKPITPLG